MTAQPPHNNRPDNQADWLDEIFAHVGIGYAGKPPHNQNSPKKVKGIPEAKAAITTKIAEERIDELNRVFDNPKWQDKSVGQVPTHEILDYLVDRIAELESLKENK